MKSTTDGEILVTHPNGGLTNLPRALALMLLPILLLLAPAPAQSTTYSGPIIGAPGGVEGMVNLPGSVVAIHVIDSGEGLLLGDISFPEFDLFVGPVTKKWPGPDLIVAPNGSVVAIGNQGTFIESEWTSGGIRRKVRTTVVGAGQRAYDLAAKRHDRLVVTSLGYWPVDP